MTSEIREGNLRSFTSGWDMFGWQEFQYSLHVVLKAFQHNLAHASIRFSTRHEVEKHKRVHAGCVDLAADIPTTMRVWLKLQAIINMPISSLHSMASKQRRYEVVLTCREVARL